MTSEAVRVCIYAHDDELRTWLVDEVALMTWIGNVQLECVTSLDELAADLVIVGADRLSGDERRALDRRSWPVIAVGNPDAIADRVLGPGLTSRELKQAIREVLPRR